MEYTNRVSIGVTTFDVTPAESGAQGRWWSPTDVQVKKQDMTADTNLSQERCGRKLRSVDHSVNVDVDHHAKDQGDE